MEAELYACNIRGRTPEAVPSSPAPAPGGGPSQQPLWETFEPSELLETVVFWGGYFLREDFIRRRSELRRHLLTKSKPNEDNKHTEKGAGTCFVRGYSCRLGTRQIKCLGSPECALGAFLKLAETTSSRPMPSPALFPREQRRSSGSTQLGLHGIGKVSRNKKNQQFQLFNPPSLLLKTLQLHYSLTREHCYP